MNKLDVQNAILNAMTPYLDDDQLYQLKNTLIEQLYGMNIVEEETRLSVGKRTKICVKKNENLCQKFCAATFVFVEKYGWIIPYWLWGIFVNLLQWEDKYG